MHLQENTLFDLDLGVKLTQNVAQYPLVLRLPCPTVKEEMHLQENTLFDLDIGVKITQNVAQYHLHHVAYSPARFEVATSNC